MVSISSFLDKTIATGLLIVIALTALVQGVVEPWAVLLFEILIAILVLCWGIKAIIEKRLELIIPATIWPVAGLLGLGLIQAISITGADGIRRSLSFDVEATRGAVLLIIALLIGGLVAGNFLIHRDRLEWLSKWLTIYGLALALFAIAQYFIGPGNLWFNLWQNTSESPFGTFVNRNHFAGYMELLLPWPLVRIILRRGHWQEQLFYGIAAAWIGAAAIISLSRGGMVSILVELIFIAGCSRYFSGDKSRRNKGNIVQIGALALILVAITTGVLWMSGEKVINRITTGQNSEIRTDEEAQTFATARGDLWRESWRVFSAHPFIGVGLGAFQIAYPIYSGDQGLSKVVGQAHNDYLQMLTDGGIIGGALVIWFLLICCRGMARGVKTREPVRRAAALAGGTALLGMLTHSLFDFNLQLPSHGLLFLVSASLLWQAGQRVTEPLEAELLQAAALKDPIIEFQGSLQ